jgi:error-prone DNA polymerase
VKGLANREGALVPLARAAGAFSSIEDLWRRAGLSVTSLERLADADAYGSLGTDSRDASWTIRGLNDEPMLLFAAADDREGRIKPEGEEPAVALVPMTEGRKVVEDYLSKGLTLRQHPVAFLRGDLRERRIIPCAALPQARDGSRVTVAGLVLVRQKPGSAKGVTFMTIEDETDVANLVLWSSIFERQRRLILSSGMIGCRGRVQREGKVIHVVAEHLIDFSDLMRSVAQRDGASALTYGDGDTFQAASGYDAPGIRVPTRDFR